MGGAISRLLSSNMCSTIFSFIAEKANYFCSLENNLDDLESKLKELLVEKEDVQIRLVRADQEENKKPLNRVLLWLERVDAVNEKCKKLQEVKSVEIDRLCLGGFCSKNLIESYGYGKEVAQLLKEMTNLKTERETFKDDVADSVPAAPALVRATEGTIVGQNSMLEEVWKFLRQKQVGMIGLYGMPGVGKTTLLTQINNKLSKERDFEVVIWVVVSSNPVIGKIQDAIGERIGLPKDTSWAAKSLEDNKATRISDTLSRKKFVLLLDDVWSWSRNDLTAVGVPLQCLESGAKILFTTRKFDVCSKMGADKKLEVKCLKFEEAWELFQQKVGKDILESDTRIRELAIQVVNECDCLPLAIITVGEAMAGKNESSEWDDAIKILKTAASRFEDMERKVFSRLKFSYDRLSNDTIRSCFLYCSLFPEDYIISKQDLIDCWIAEGYLNEYNTGYSILGTLLRACLLEGGDNYDDVKMHDVLRDMALWIASDIEKEKENFSVQAGIGLTEALEVEKWEGIKRLSLMENEIESLTSNVICPNLLGLFLQGNNLQVIGDDFFQHMSSLKVLDLSRNKYLSKLPSGISKIVSLKHLDLSHTGIRKLPKELCALVNLKCFKMVRAYSLHTVPKQLISEFRKLQVFRITDCSLENSAREDNVLFGGCEVLVEELIGLKHLIALSITLKSWRALQILLSSHKLRSCTQTLFLAKFEASTTLDVLLLKDLENLRRVRIDNCNRLEEMKIDCPNISSIKTHGFHKLQSVSIQKCPSLCDLTWLIFAADLKSIHVFSCDSMEEMIDTEKLSAVQRITGDLKPFEKLQYLRIYSSRSLKSIYPNALSFPHLKGLDVIDCRNLKKLPLNSDGTKHCQFVIRGQANWWNELHWDDEATRNAFLPCFESYPRREWFHDFVSSLCLHDLNSNPRVHSCKSLGTVRGLPRLT